MCVSNYLTCHVTMVNYMAVSVDIKRLSKNFSDTIRQLLEILSVGKKLIDFI